MGAACELQPLPGNIPAHTGTPHPTPHHCPTTALPLLWCALSPHPPPCSPAGGGLVSLAWLARGSGVKSLVEYLPASLQAIPDRPTIERLKELLAQLTAVPLPPLLRELVRGEPHRHTQTAGRGCRSCWLWGRGGEGSRDNWPARAVSSPPCLLRPYNPLPALAATPSHHTTPHMFATASLRSWTVR